jgi:hypothetical protein
VGVAAARTPTAILVRAVAFATAVVLIATGCGGASSRYVTNEAAETYFKLPKEWQVTPVMGGNEEGFLRGSPWAVFFAPEGTDVRTLNDPNTSTVPLGRAVIGQIEQGVYDQFNDIRLRAILFVENGEVNYLDPIEVLNSQDDDFVRILGLEPVQQNGLRGYKLRYQIRQDPSLQPLVWEQTTLVHDPTHTYYSFSVVCPYECFARNQDDIAAIFESLRVRKDQP